MLKFIKLTSEIDGKNIIINPLHIIAVQPDTFYGSIVETIRRTYYIKEHEDVVSERIIKALE